MNTPIFDAERVDVISIPAGKLYPWQLNTRACVCQHCRQEQIPAGSAVRFMKGYHNDSHNNGYFCRTCVVGQLEKCDWHWNPVTEELFPSRPYTQHPLSGADLAAAFRLEGERGLFQVIAGRKRA